MKKMILLAGVLAVASAALSGCSGGGGGDNTPPTSTGQPDLDVKAARIEFGNVTQGATTSNSLTITNNGTGELTISGISAPSSPFSISSDQCTGTVAAGGNCTVTVAYTPSTTGSHTSAMIISSDDADYSSLSVDLLGSAGDLTLVNMPGTQPGKAGAIEGVAQCLSCHGGVDSGVGGVPDGIAEGPYDTWKTSMMSMAAKDPLYWALVAVENKLFASKGVAIGDYCLRCHVPKGWLEERSEPATGSAFLPDDLNGVLCDVCHRMVDPTSTEGLALTEEDVETYRNAQYVVASPVSGKDVKRGPYEVTTFNGKHDTAKSDFHLTSEFCGTCHEITNPFYNNTVMVEKTYTEWKNSSYPAEGTQCQTCHMPRVTGYASVFLNPLRDDIGLHNFSGGNTWAPYAVAAFDPSMPASYATTSSARAQSMLETAATLEGSSDGTTLTIKVTNNSGHKLPTGFTEGRRMWINVKFYDTSGVMVSELGGYDETTATLSSAGTTVYEANPGTKDIDGFADEPSFHFALNNHMYKDNRIPPKGFTNSGFEANGAHIVGATYADGQNFDTVTYTVPANAKTAEVSLKYQTTSKEFIEFLRDENLNNPYDVKNAGAQIYTIWENTGKATPATMGTITVNL
ncbi:MAG: choice-of-anchor D domain-containing protein [Proteobacteria bacterium]|nr:choice-of-anchor D domain-containing protein [Pseudomonadota bacterium]MBU1688540.1 choice-of-anchor D domain-containing protein [Pseudomonadota bacterium]